MDNLDTVLTWKEGHIYFIKGNLYINYNRNYYNIKFGLNQTIEQGIGASFPASFHQGIDAGLMRHNGKAFFFVILKRLKRD
jgi:hypothetical protein